MAIKGIRIGHINNEQTGVTVILAPKGAVGGVDVRGGAPGTRETDLLDSSKAIAELHAVVLTGGSAYGLEASCGVVDYLRGNGFGYHMGEIIVPLVSAAVIFDLTKDYIYPDKQMGYNACAIATEDNCDSGRIGAGKGATVGKIRGGQFADNGGVGYATMVVGGATISAIIVVNAMGDIFDHNTNQIIAGARDNDGNFLDTRKCVLEGNYTRLMLGSNTTIGVIMTNAKLSKVDANKLAKISHNGLAQSIRPVHTDFDGDTLFVMSTGEVDCDFNMLSIGAVEVVSQAITNSIGNKYEK